MTKFEYTTVAFDFTDSDAVAASLTELGEAGWDLIHVDDNVGYFKRVKSFEAYTGVTQRLPTLTGSITIPPSGQARYAILSSGVSIAAYPSSDNWEDVEWGTVEWVTIDEDL